MALEKKNKIKNQTYKSPVVRNEANSSSPALPLQHRVLGEGHEGLERDPRKLHFYQSS